MHILYISQYFPPEMGAPSARVSELSAHWANAGHRVTVLTGFPNHPTGKLHPEYRSRFRRLIYREMVGGVKVIRTWLLPFPNRKSYERIFNYASFWISASFTGIFLNKPDAIVATTPQLLVGMVGWLLGKFKRVPFVLEVRDIWPDSIVASDVGSDETLLIRALRKIASFLYRSSDHIVVVTSAFKSYLIENLETSVEKISIVQNGIETDFFASNNGIEKTRAKLGVEGKFVLSYIGTHGFAHGLGTALRAAALLNEVCHEIVIIFVGEGAEKKNLVAEAEKSNLSNVLFFDSQPRHRIPSIIRASDACMVLLKKREIFKTVIPTKMLEFLACSRPVILGVDGQAREVLETAKAGIFIPPEDSNALVEATLLLFRDSMLRKELGENGRSYVVENLSRHQTAKQYIDVLDGVISEYSQ